VLRIEDLGLKKPGGGLASKERTRLVGKTLARVVSKNEMIFDTDLD
jgi:hypothetical protein